MAVSSVLWPLLLAAYDAEAGAAFARSRTKIREMAIAVPGKPPRRQNALLPWAAKSGGD